MIKLLDRLSFLSCVVCFCLLFSSCKQQNETKTTVLSQVQESVLDVIPGAENIAHYYPMLEGKKVGLVVNQTSTIGNEHLVDSLLVMNTNITTIFAPEHGFRGEADAGEVIKDGKDASTGIPVISLYGKKKKPLQEDLQNIEILIFDIQDVGARFYTYISSLHYVMEACAEAGIPVIVLDRPNPNGHYIDGPILEPDFTSFVGMHPVPTVYGMTIGEYATMINGEQWLKDGIQCDLTVIQCNNYTHDTFYELPIKPSPNLPNIKSIYLYPSLCFFEGTTVSVGRGTETQFQVVGHPSFTGMEYKFTPKAMPGAKYPKHENQLCYGMNLSKKTTGSLKDKAAIDLSYLIDSYKNLTSQKKQFFNDNNFFEKLAGTQQLREQISAGLSEDEIRLSWAPGLTQFKKTRAKYLLYD